MYDMKRDLRQGRDGGRRNKESSIPYRGMKPVTRKSRRKRMSKRR